MKVRNDERLEQEMSSDGLDLVLAFSMENVFYLSGALFALQDNIRDRLSVAGFSRGGRDFLLCATNELNSVADSTHIDPERHFAYVEFERSPIAALAEVLVDLGFGDARIGVEKRYLMAAYYEELAKLLPKASLLAADRAIEAARAIKLPNHIEVIQRGSRATERAIASGFAAVRRGDTERDLAQEIIRGLYREGAHIIRHAVITAGDNAKKAHPFPSAEKRLDPGDMIRVDVGGLFDGFGTDLARMAIVGSPSAEQLNRYRTVQRCVSEVGQTMRSGMTAGDVYARVSDFYAKMGIPNYKRDHVGHSLSILGSHDDPLLYPGNQTALEENMVIALEPILRDEEGRRCTVEDVFVVEKAGSRLLSCEISTSDMPQIL
jgi:Xaa-Pro dipeptidase